MGGMAETFVARRRDGRGFEQRVCIKVMNPVCRSSPEFGRLFRREAQLAGLLRHSNIVSVVDFLGDESVLVLELVEGADLRALLRRQPLGQLPPDVVCWIGMELCKALDYAHRRTFHGRPHGIVHRDISPSNVLVSYAGEVKLADFGIAKAMAGVDEEQSNVKGKIAYMSPEQAAGHVVDGRSDLFSLGVVLYELLAGQRPFGGANDAETLQQLVAGRYLPLREYGASWPVPLMAVVERLLSVRPADRFAGAESVARALSVCAPPGLTYLKLAELTRAARPHQTLHTELSLPLVEGGPEGGPGLEVAGADMGILPGVPTRPALPGEGPPASADVGGTLPMRVHRARIRSIDKQPRTDYQGLGLAADEFGPTGGLSSSRRVGLERESGGRLGFLSRLGWGMWGALGLLLVLWLGGDLLPMMRGFQSGPTRVPVAAVHAVTPDTVSLVPRKAGSAPPTRESVGGMLWAGFGPQVSLVAPNWWPQGGMTRRCLVEHAAPENLVQSVHGSARPSGSQRPRPSSPGEANRVHPLGVIQVAVFPGGRVWLNGQLRGRAPVNLRLPAGTHWISVGQDQPTLRRRIAVVGGKTHELFFNLRATEPTRSP